MAKLPTFLFLWLLFFSVILVALLFSTSPQNATGVVDETFKTLQKSGQTVASVSIAKWLSYVYGIGIIGVFSLFVFLGAYKANPIIKSQIYKSLSVGVAVYLLVYTAMIWSWWDYTATNSMDYFLGLPKPTAWMFALMLIPLFISSCYIYKFQDWVYTKEDEARFQDLSLIHI